MSATTSGWFRSSTAGLRARHRFHCPLGRSHGWTPCRVSPCRLRMFQVILVLSNGRTDQFGHTPAKLRPRPTSWGRRSECALGTMLLPQPRTSLRSLGPRFPTPLNRPIRRRLHATQTRRPLPQNLRAGSSPAPPCAGCARSVGPDPKGSTPWPLEPWPGDAGGRGCSLPAERFWDYAMRAAEADAWLCRGATALGIGCIGDRWSPGADSPESAPSLGCPRRYIGAGSCLRKTSGVSGDRALERLARLRPQAADLGGARSKIGRTSCYTDLIVYTSIRADR